MARPIHSRSTTYSRASWPSDRRAKSHAIRRVASLRRRLCFAMTHHASRNRGRISAGDSLKKPALARGDEPKTREAQKFFDCQITRLRVRATRFRTVATSCDGAVRVMFVDEANDKSDCSAGVFCNPDNRRRGIFAHNSHRFKTRCNVVVQCAPHSRTLSRQHFLKRDTVFFNVLVYSGCSAFRFPSARSD